MTSAQVNALAVKVGFDSGHNVTMADLVTAGLSPTDIANFKAHTNGGFVADSVFMTQLAYEESGFIANCHGIGPKDDSYGLWQINMLGPLGPANRAQFALARDDQLFDPETNAKVARAFVVRNMGGGTGSSQAMSPHSLYIDFGPWLGSIPKAIHAIASGVSQVDPSTGGANAAPGLGSGGLVPSQVGGAISSVIGGATSVLDVLKAFFGVITNPTWWKRIGIAALGFAIIMGAVIFYNKDTIAETGGEVAKGAALA
jgi:hypothetical protein